MAERVIFRVKDPKGADVVVRYAGRRLRVTREWAAISLDAVPALLAEAGDLLEQKGSEAPPPPEPEPQVEPDPSPEPSTPKRKPRGKKE